jgi:hypothetical protein
MRFVSARLATAFLDFPAILSHIVRLLEKYGSDAMKMLRKSVISNGANSSCLATLRRSVTLESILFVFFVGREGSLNRISAGFSAPYFFVTVSV